MNAPTDCERIKARAAIADLRRVVCCIACHSHPDEARLAVFNGKRVEVCHRMANLLPEYKEDDDDV